MLICYSSHKQKFVGLLSNILGCKRVLKIKRFENLGAGAWIAEVFLPEKQLRIERDKTRALR